MFSFASKLVLLHKALVSKKGRVNQYWGRSREGEFQSGDNKSVKLLPAFRLENYARHYNFAAENYQQTTSARSAVHVPAVEKSHSLLAAGSIVQRSSSAMQATSVR